MYVHIPFCASRCDYCDFATWTDRAHLVDDYVAACITDIRRRALPDATSVFFGGGTPSLLAADALTAILDAIPRAAGAEVTVECNPDTLDHEKLAGYRAAGVTRISLGVQSMVEWSCSGALKSAEIANRPSDQIIAAMNSITRRCGQVMAVSSTRLSTRTTESWRTNASSRSRFS